MKFDIIRRTLFSLTYLLTYLSSLGSSGLLRPDTVLSSKRKMHESLRGAIVKKGTNKIEGKKEKEMRLYE